MNPNRKPVIISGAEEMFSIWELLCSKGTGDSHKSGETAKVMRWVCQVALEDGLITRLESVRNLGG